MDKPLFDSDVDPKRIKNVADGLRRQGEFESARMLDSYADLLEAQDKAVPVAWMEIPPGEQADPYYPGYSFHGLTSLPSGRHDLFLRPMTSPADAERLAEALRELANRWEQRDYDASRARNAAGHDHAMDLRQMIAAHSAQAQPKPSAQGLADRIMEIIHPHLDTGDSRTAAGWAVEIYHAICTYFGTAQPPAASVSVAPDEPEERCESGDPACGPVEYHDSEGVPLCKACWDALVADYHAAQENPNG